MNNRPSWWPSVARCNSEEHEDLADAFLDCVKILEGVMRATSPDKPTHAWKLSFVRRDYSKLKRKWGLRR